MRNVAMMYPEHNETEGKIMDTENMIDITKADLSEVVKAAYDLSEPAGLGFLHYEEGGLSDEESNSLINNEGRIAVSMDYVKGRCCKMTVFRDEDKKLYIHGSWYDHTEKELNTLLDRAGIKA